MGFMQVQYNPQEVEEVIMCCAKSLIRAAHKALLLQVRNDDNPVCSNDTPGEALLGKFIESNE